MKQIIMAKCMAKRGGGDDGEIRDVGERGCIETDLIQNINIFEGVLNFSS